MDERPSNEKCVPALDYLSPTNTNFFQPAPEDNLHAEPQLYSVELQPVCSPAFMVPGIYRKIDTVAAAPFSTQSKPNNVFLTANESRGRVVRVGEFQKLYVCEKELELNNNGQPRRVFPKKDVQQCTEGSVKAPPKIGRSGSSVIKKWDALTKLAYNVLKLSSCDHTVVINRKRNEIIRTDKKTQQKTIYRFLSNESLGVEPLSEKHDTSTHSCVQKPKLGRPKKRVFEDNSGGTTTDTPSKVRIITPPVVGEKSNCNNENPIKSKLALSCSRFGRVIQPVRPVTLPMQQKVEDQVVYSLTEETNDLISDLKDKDFTCNLKPKQVPVLPLLTLKKCEEESIPVPIAASSPTKRHVPPESICPTCKKVFLGRRLKRHFVSHPDHMKLETPNTLNEISNNSNEDITLFRFLVSKLQKSNLNEDQRADLFLNELNDLVEQLQLRSSRLIRNTSGLHLVTARTARVLGLPELPEGQYALDMSAIDATPEPEPSCLMNYEVNVLPVPSNNTRSLDYTALSLDDTLTDEAAQKLNLSAGGKLLPPSEESLLRAVDDLVPPTGITKLVVSTNLINRNMSVSTTTSSDAVDTIVPHYDHASDNAVEAVSMKECSTGRQAQPILDLAVDFFQFNSKK